MATTGVCTDDEALVRTRAAIKAALSDNNDAIRQKEVEPNNRSRASRCSAAFMFW
jgi:hypothetical protein